MTRLPTKVLLLCTFVQILSYAQDSPGVVVSGTVLDPHQAGVLGAKVTLKRVDNNEPKSTNADASGTFRFDGVQLGNYDIRIEQEGFKPYVSRVRVGNQVPRPMNVVLGLADFQQQVTVGGELTQSQHEYVR